MWAGGQFESIAFRLITGGQFTFGFEGDSICSGLVARSLNEIAEHFAIEVQK
jgi:hypothetical protein